MPRPGDSAAALRLRRLEGRLDRAAALAVADADEFEDGPGAGVAQARLGQPQDAGVAAGPIGEPRGDLAEEHAHGLLVAQQPQGAAPGGHHRGDRLVPLAASRSLCAPRPPLLACRSALGSSWSAASCCGKARRAIVMHFSTSGRTSLAFSIVVMMRPLTLGLLSSHSASRSVRNSARGQAPQQGPLMTGIAAEFPAFSSMSHGRSFRCASMVSCTRSALPRPWHAYSTPAGAGGSRMPRRRPMSGSFSRTSVKRRLAEVADFEQLALRCGSPGRGPS